MVRSRRRKPTARFFIIVVLIALAIALAFFFVFRGPSRGQVTKGTIQYTEENLSVIIMRDERVHTEERFGRAQFFVAEGERVEAGSKVAEVYALGSYNEKTLSELTDVQKEIRDYQEKVLGGAQDKDVTDLNTKINAKLREISQVVQGQTQGDMVTLERQLEELMDTKRQKLKTIVKEDNTLTALYEKEGNILQRIGEWKTDVKAEDNGIISFNLDGYESKLTLDTIGDLKRSDFKDISKGVTITDTIDKQSLAKPLYRLVNNYLWYTVVVVDDGKTMDQLVDNDQFVLEFEGFYDRPYQGRVLKSQVVEGGARIYIFEMGEDIASLVNVRNAKMSIKKEYGNGDNEFKVPKNAIFKEDDRKFIKVIQDSQAISLEVHVLIEDKESAIIVPIGDNVTLAEKMEIVLR